VFELIDKRTRERDIQAVLKRHYPKPEGQIVEEYTHQDQKAVEDAYDTAIRRVLMVLEKNRGKKC